MPKNVTTLRFAIAATILASAAVPPALAKDTRASASISKSGYKSDGKANDNRGRGHDEDRGRGHHGRGPRDGFPDNHGQDEACEHANYHSPNHCHNDSLG